MNIILWIIQIILAVLSLAGGAYKLFFFQFDARIPSTSAFSRGGWAAMGVFEVVCAILLILPAATKWMPVLTPLSAAALALESLALAVVYAQYSLAAASTNPLAYVVPMVVMAVFVAYGRYSLSPPG